MALVVFKPNAYLEERVVLSDEEHERIRNAIDVVSKVYRLEELYHMLLETAAAFNAEVYTRVDKGRFTEFNDVDNDLYRVQLGIKASSFFTLFWTYKDYLSEGGQFDYDESVKETPVFKRCQFIRNYIQHVGMLSLTIRQGGKRCALDDVAVFGGAYAEISSIRKNLSCLKEPTQQLFAAFGNAPNDIDMYALIASALDLITEMHQRARRSRFVTESYRQSVGLLADYHKRFVEKGYKQCETTNIEGEREVKSFYLFDRQIKQVDWFVQHHRCDKKIENQYVMMMPEHTLCRMASADKDIQQFRDRGGIIAQGKKYVVTSSRYAEPYSEELDRKGTLVRIDLNRVEDEKRKE